MADDKPADPSEGELCICFHVSRRQIVKFLRLRKPRLASQCSECYGAGTGCGWCIPFLESMFEQVKAGVENPVHDLSPEEYRARRREYHRRTGARPPAVDPLPPPETDDPSDWIDAILPE